MGLIELFLIAVGLSMDAFAVSVCKGLAMPKCTFKKAAIVGLWFGGFQALMPKTMFLLAVATSIDALAIGITFAFLKVNIIPAVCFIGIVTFIISFAGVKIGNVFGARYKNKAEIVGGVILILLGLKILLEHLGFLG